MAAILPFETVLKEILNNDDSELFSNRPLYSSSGEEEPKYDFIGEAINIFTTCDVIYEQRERVFHRDIQTRENNV